MLATKQRSDVASACETICVVWTLGWHLSSVYLSPAHKGHGYLRDVDCGGICWERRGGVHSEEGLGEFLHDALWAEPLPQVGEVPSTGW